MKINLKHNQFDYILIKDSSFANNSGHLQTFHNITTIQKLLSELIKLPENKQLLRKHSFDLVQAHSIKNLSDDKYVYHVAQKILYKNVFFLKIPIDIKGNGNGNGDGKKANNPVTRSNQKRPSGRNYAPATHPLYNVNHAVRTPPEIYRPFVCAFDPPPSIDSEKEELRIIDVQYLDSRNNPIPGATYRIESLNNGVPDGRFKASGTTDDQGLGHIDGVPLDISSINYTFHNDPQPYEVDPKFKPKITPDIEKTKSTFDSIIDWILGTAQGDFNKNQSMSQIAVNAVLGLIPLVDQALDLRDIIAGLKSIIEFYSDDEDRQNNKAIYPDTFGVSFEMWMWVNVFIIAIGCIPELGSAVKGVLKAIIEFCQKNLEKATDVINAKNAKLLWEQVVRILNYFGKGGNAHRWLKELPDLLASKMDDAALKIRGGLDTIQDLLIKAQEYANTQTGKFLIGNDKAAELTQHISKIKKAIGKAYTRLDEMKVKVNEWLREKIMEMLGGKHEPALVGATGNVGSPHMNVRMQELEEPPSGNFAPQHQKPHVSPHKIAMLDDAKTAQKHASDLHKKLPRKFKNKTIASDDIITASYSKSPVGGFDAPHSTQAMLEYSKHLETKYGYTVGASGAMDWGTNGASAINHAEKQVAVSHMANNMNKPIGVSKEMCGDCRNFFSAHAQDVGKDIVVADPKYTRVFRSDGYVEIYDSSNNLIKITNEPPKASLTKYEGEVW